VDLAILAPINPFSLDIFKPLRKKEQTKISKILDPRLICFIDVRTRGKAIEKLIESLDLEGRIPDKDLFQKQR